MNNKVFSWDDWVRHIEQTLAYQQQQIFHLESEVHRLKLEIQDKTSSPIFHVDKIEYHFDQLKVDTLEGSLQIGMSTTSVNQLPVHLEDLAYKQHPPTMKPTNEPNLKKAEPLKTAPIYDYLKDYLMKNGRSIIETQIEAEPFDFSEDHISTMINDIVKQLPARINHYAKQIQKDNRELSSEQIIIQTKQDVLTAIQNHIKQSAAQWRDYQDDHQSE